MRKVFACGHIGKGSYCHRCLERDRLMAVKVAVRFQSRMALDNSIAVLGGIECGGLPEEVIHKAASVIGDLRGGVDPRVYNGKILKYHSDGLLSVPLGWSYRMVCSRDYVVRCVMSHEEYNKRWRTI